MAAFTVTDGDTFHDDDGYQRDVDAEHPIAAAEAWIAEAASHGYELPSSFEVLVRDEAERVYSVRLAYIEHPSEWAERVRESGVWRASP